ncbi:MAG: hypothetical protein ABSG75_00800 [Syntrophales bacterium]|jgi:outer membrane biosynthesis protein TonB
MGSRKKETQERQKAYFERGLEERLSFLAKKGIESPGIDKDTLVKRLRANIRAINDRLKAIAGNERRTEELAKIKEEKEAEKAASKAVPKDKAEKKGKSSKEAPPEGKEKKKKKEKEPKQEQEQEKEPKQEKEQKPEKKKVKEKAQEKAKEKEE